MNLRSLALSLGLFLTSGTFAACGGPLHYAVRSPLDRGADAQVTARISEAQHQTQLEVTVTKLSTPDRMAEGSTVYVAWARKDEDTSWARLGTLTYDAEEETGEIKATTNQIAFDFAISAETSGDAEAPSKAIVFLQRVED